MVKADAAVVDMGHRVGHNPLGLVGLQLLAQVHQLFTQSLVLADAEAVQRVTNIPLVRNHNLGGVGGRGGPDIRHIVGYCHIRLMPHGGDDRQL